MSVTGNIDRSRHNLSKSASIRTAQYRRGGNISALARSPPDLFPKARGVDTPVTEGIDLAYEVPTLLGEYTREARGVDVGFWRGVGPGYTKFAVECMIDEVAGAGCAAPLA